MAEIEFDPKKNAINIAKRGVSLARAAEIKPMLVKYDQRFNYGEERMVLFGYIDDAPHCLCYVERSGMIRAISLRRMHQKEFRRHVKNNKTGN